MAEWVRLCGLVEAPGPGSVAEIELAERSVCVANVGGELAALDNICPHRLGPLGQGWVEGGAVVCPWHCWAFDVKTGVAAYPDKGQVAVFPVRVEDGDVLIALPEREPGEEPFAVEENF